MCAFVWVEGKREAEEVEGEVEEAVEKDGVGEGDMEAVPPTKTDIPGSRRGGRIECAERGGWRG